MEFDAEGGYLLPDFDVTPSAEVQVPPLTYGAIE